LPLLLLIPAILLFWIGAIMMEKLGPGDKPPKQGFLGFAIWLLWAISAWLVSPIGAWWERRRERESKITGVIVNPDTGYVFTIAFIVLGFICIYKAIRCLF
jgi:hypothetical protein